MRTRTMVGFAIAAGFFSNAILVNHVSFLTMMLISCVVATGVLAILWTWQIGNAINVKAVFLALRKNQSEEPDNFTHLHRN